MTSLLPPLLHLHHKPATQSLLKPHRQHHQHRGGATRRSILLLIPPSLLLAQPASAFDFRMTVPDQTLEEAKTEIQTHAKMLLEVHDLLMAESWKEAQRSLRRSSSLLKQDIYTIIQEKPSEERPRLRRLYSDLFNAVTRLDYTARDEDKIRAWECYKNVVLYLDDILSRV